MKIRDRLLLASINNLDKNYFKKNFQKLSTSDRDFFYEKILNDKFSPVFMNYIQSNNLDDLIQSQKLKSFKIQIRRFQIQSLEIINEVIYINKLLKKENLKPIFLKGVALMVEYDNISQRPAVDIDILFEKNEALKSYEILMNNDFNCELTDFSTESLKDYVKETNHLPHLRRKTNITIEIHTRASLPHDFENCPLSKKILSNKKSFNFYGEDILIPSLNDLIVHQLVHFSLNSNFNHILRISSDIAKLEQNYKIDWNEIYKDYDNRKVRKALSLSLEMLNYNQKLTNNFDDLKMKYENFFPSRRTILKTYNKTFNSINEKERIRKNTLYELGSAKNFVDFLSKIYSKIFSKRNEIVNKYKISNPNFFNLIYYSFLNFFSKVFRYTPILINLQFRKGAFFKKFEDVKQIEDWLNS